MTSDVNNNPILRTQNAVALCVIVILAMTWKLYETQVELRKELLLLHDEIVKVEKSVLNANSNNAKERIKSRALQTRTALYAMVPCDRSPGGLCPVTSDPSRRVLMLQELIEELGVKNLQGVNLQGMHLSGINFKGVNLSYAQLDYSDLSGADLSGLDLRYTSLIGADLNGANLSNAILVGADLTGAGIEGSKFNGAQLQTADLRGAHACKADFSKAKLGASWFQGTTVWGANLSDTNAIGHFRGAHANKETKWKGEKPDGVIMDERSNEKFDVVLPAYGPEAAPFNGGKPSSGTTCPKYKQN